ncbi:hypothetical protein M8J76_013833 [Diaphorina citri]|nr:hypothetical protein M8J76_013833 [Diaphorina citri]
MTSTSSYNEAFANQVSRLVIEKYNKLPKTGKPNVNESQWTLLSGICLEENGQLSVVALATGTKCLGVTSYSKHGDVLHDSHAENSPSNISVRDASQNSSAHETSHDNPAQDNSAQGSVQNNAQAIIHNSSSQDTKLNHSAQDINFNHSAQNSPQNTPQHSAHNSPHNSSAQDSPQISSPRFVLKPHIKFHFYTSHTPCGDASIFPRHVKHKFLIKIQNQAKRLKLEKDFLKRRKTEVDKSKTEVNNLKSPREEEKTGAKSPDKDPMRDHQTEKESSKNHDNDSQDQPGIPKKDPHMVKNDLKRAGPNSPNEESSQEIFAASSSEESGAEDSLSGDVGSMVQDFHRTGAKILPGSSRQDPRGSGPEFHLTGVVRTKPGRGDPTYSMSCSDKIAKWNAVGWEGTLLSMLVTAPIFMSSISVGGGIAFSQDALQRALLTRVSHLIVPPPPALLKADVVFPAGKRSVKREMKRLGRPICSAHPVGASIIWCNATYSRREECVNLPYSKVKLLASGYQERMNHCKEALGKWLEVPEEFRQFAVKDMNEKL